MGLTLSTTRPNHIMGVVDGSPAAVAGLVVKDVITDINGMEVTGWNAKQLEIEWNRWDIVNMAVVRPKAGEGAGSR